MKKLSIITINLNNVKGLTKTIESVVSQTFADYEYIIIDGGSTDGSVEIIKQYADKITYWVSEPDRGVYHALNKGIEQAKGEYCYFLNSGDWILQNSGLQYVFDKNPVEDILYCDVLHGKKKCIYPDKLSMYFFFETTITHQASFIKRSLFSTYGLYNEKYKIVSDWEFWLKTIIKGQCSYLHIPFLLVYYDIEGMSWTSHFNLLEMEKAKILEENFPEMYEFYKELLALREEMHFYKDSKLIQIVRKIQMSRFYKKIRK